jgi:hypothetical protein
MKVRFYWTAAICSAVAGIALAFGAAYCKDMNAMLWGLAFMCFALLLGDHAEAVADQKIREEAQQVQREGG